MATVAHCPSCRTQLGLPADAPRDAQCQCPVCASQFSLADTPVHALPIARLASPAASTVVDSAWPLAPHEGKSNGLAAAPVETTVDFDWGAPAAPPAQPIAAAPISTDAIAAESPEPTKTSRLEQLLTDLPANAADAGAAAPDSFGDFDSSAPTVTLARGETVRLDDDLSLDGFDAAAEEHVEQFDVGDDLAATHDSGVAHRPSHRDFVLRPSPKRRPNRSAARMLVGTVLGGIAGLLLAAYALIWLRGPQLDLFHMAKWLPPVMLPSSMQVADDTGAARGIDRTLGGDDADLADAGDLLEDDGEDLLADDGDLEPDGVDLLSDDTAEAPLEPTLPAQEDEAPAANDDVAAAEVDPLAEDPAAAAGNALADLGIDPLDDPASEDPLADNDAGDVTNDVVAADESTADVDAAPEGAADEGIVVDEGATTNDVAVDESVPANDDVTADEVAADEIAADDGATDTDVAPPTDQVAAADPAPANEDAVESDPDVLLASNDEPLPAADDATGIDELPTESGAGETTTTDPILPPEHTPATWPSTPIVGDLIAPRFYSLDELDEAATAADEAGRTFVAGNLQTSASPKEMGHAYVKLCAVAERLTMLDPATFSIQMFDGQTRAKEPFELVARDAARRNDLGEIAAKWWTYGKRQNLGVLFVGRVREVHQQGEWTECIMEVGAGDLRVDVPVLMDGVRFSTGSEAAVVGIIVADPQRQIAGYQGDAKQTVIAGWMFDPAKLAEPVTIDAFDSY